MRFFDRELDLREIRRLTGDPSQLAGVTPVEFTEGGAKGVRALQVRTGGGLRFTVVLDRGMDLAEAELDGIPLGWRTGAGYVHPAFYDPRGDEWLRTYEGGLMTLGGLTHMGDPSEDQGEAHGLHGRIALVPAAEAGYRVSWEDGEIEVFGALREFKPLTRHLELRRWIRSGIGARSISITDVVTNLGRRPEPHMILYHVNLGFPLMDAGSRFLAPIRRTIGWDELSEARKEFCTDVPGFRDEEYVFGHEVSARDGIATAALVNPSIRGGMVAAVRFRPSELPHFWQWVSLYPGSLVMGIEPGNSHIRGRAAARAAGILPVLAPGESVTYRIEIVFGIGHAAVRSIEREVAAQKEAGRT